MFARRDDLFVVDWILLDEHRVLLLVALLSALVGCARIEIVSELHGGVVDIGISLECWLLALEALQARVLGRGHDCVIQA